MKHKYMKENRMHTTFCPENLEGRGHLGEQQQTIF